MPPDLENLFPHSTPINSTAATLDHRIDWPTLPAKCAVYLLACGESGAEPLLLATVGNLRAALQRRLTELPPDAHSKRVPYGQICTRVHWRIIHSPFAANWWYWQAARSLFPDHYTDLLGWHPSWWIAVDRAAPFPKLRRTQDLSDPALSYAGPIRDRTSAGKLIDTLEDLFDLCRYHHILLQTPHGKACAYKEMGKCPAPCDGSVPLSWYESQMHAAFRFLTNENSSRRDWRAREDSRMKQAAATLAFEQAARIKQRLDRAKLIDADPYAEMAPLRDFRFLALQPGPGRVSIEPWWIHHGHIECWPHFKKKDLAAALPLLLDRCTEKARAPAPPIDAAAIEQIGLVAHHLFRGDREPGSYLRLHDLLTGGIPYLTQKIEAFFNRKSAPSALTEQASDHPPPAANAPPDLTPPAPVEDAGNADRA